MKEISTMVLIWIVMYLGFSIMTEDLNIFDWKKVHRQNYGGLFIFTGVLLLIFRYVRKLG